MVRLSSRCTVAIHALTLLARSGDGQLQSSGEIADSLSSNPVAVRRLLGQLRDAGLVVSVEGHGGGWRLARPARRISLRDAYLAVEEGPVLPGYAHPPSEMCVVGRNMHAVLDEEFEQAERAMLDRLARTTIATMLARVLERERA
ncbi:Rrf2 family transcriptional regulator [Actinocatenispora rupis]|uniref:Rrf2 family transcriptional regulator n=1 Tax=Actinocatenispora rupis TaxID=519421 RepID=A0A8J3J5R9_9ACTN|nr:Rrf2 family transcriptional regulator [Actinocatenispora rupis]